MRHAAGRRRRPPSAVGVAPTAPREAIKHNRLTEAEPLTITVAVEPAHVVVTNPLRPKTSLRPGTGTGLANLRERIALLTAGELEVATATGEFRVRLPLVL